MSREISEELTYAWNYFQLHAEQRLKTFNFYIVIMTLLIGAGYTLLSTQYSCIIVFIGGLISFFSFIFWKLDIRNKELIYNSEECLREIEKNLKTKIFTKEYENKKSNDAKDEKRFFKYHYSFTNSFNLVFFIFAFLGVSIIFFFIIYLIILHLKEKPLILTFLFSGYFSFICYMLLKRKKKLRILITIILFMSLGAIIFSNIDSLYRHFKVTHSTHFNNEIFNKEKIESNSTLINSNIKND